MLVELAKAPREKPHLAAAARFCLGEIPWTEVLKQPRNAAEFCETFFYMGMGALARGLELDAIEYFRACRAAGYRSYSEHDLAAVELLRLGLAADPIESAAPEKPGSGLQR